jgi:hypothetical protein
VSIQAFMKLALKKAGTQRPPLMNSVLLIHRAGLLDSYSGVRRTKLVCVGERGNENSHAPGAGIRDALVCLFPSVSPSSNFALL